MLRWLQWESDEDDDDVKLRREKWNVILDDVPEQLSVLLWRLAMQKCPDTFETTTISKTSKDDEDEIGKRLQEYELLSIPKALLRPQRSVR